MNEQDNATTELIRDKYSNDVWGLKYSQLVAGTIGRQTVDKFMQLFKAEMFKARIDELLHIDDPNNVSIYRDGLLSFDDRLAELKAKLEEVADE